MSDQKAAHKKQDERKAKRSRTKVHICIDRDLMLKGEEAGLYTIRGRYDNFSKWCNEQMRIALKKYNDVIEI
jgi:hypothetical protein